MSIIVRSIIFNLSFYLVLFVYLIVALPTLLMPRGVLIRLVKNWSRVNFWLLRHICNLRYEVIGAEKIGHGPLLVASKHQSLWETFALMTVFDDPAYILKRELMWIPFFGWCAWKTRHDPGRPRRRLAGAGRHDRTRAKTEVERHRQLIIFPEGTRRAPGAEPKYKFGVAHLYSEIGVPCLPVALNSGLFWPRRSFRRYPGTIKVRHRRSDRARARQAGVLCARADRHRDGDRAACRRGEARRRRQES